MVAIRGPSEAILRHQFRPTRRDCLAAVPAALLAGPALGQPDRWTLWAEAFLDPEGRVVDALQGGISHSEGQAYGMVLAAAFGDEARFEAMRGWAEARLAVRRDPLLAWRWVPGEAEGARDYNNASDGDLFYAWALLRGARLWGREDLAARAAAVAGALAGIGLAPDPRGLGTEGGGELLLPAAEGFREGGALTLNPSYWMPRAMHDLAAAFDLPRLAAAAEHQAALLWEVAEAGPVPDWLRLDAGGWAPSPRHRAVSGFEAVRVPLWLVWSGRAGHPAVARALESRGPDGSYVIRSVDGSTPSAAAPDPGYAAVLRLADCASFGAAGEVGAGAPQPYYPATLHLLAAAAAREATLACG